MSFTKEDELNDSQVSELRDLFFKFDTERTGTVAFEHVDEILRAAARVITDPEFKKRVKSTVPGDLGKKVQFPEFVDLVQKCTRAFSPQTDLRDAFRVFDRDGHGFITTAELRHVVTTLGERMTDEEADELVREADPTNAGHVDYEEFIKTITTPLPPDQYGVPPKKRPPPSTELQEPGPDDVTPSASGMPAERASVSVVSETQPAGSEVAVAAPAPAEGGDKSAASSAPSSEHRSEHKSGQGSGKSSGKGSVSGSAKGSVSASAKGSASASGKGSASGSAAGSAEGSKKSSRKGSGTGDSPAAPAVSGGPPVEAVVHDAPAEKKDGQMANK
ncbi:hypothetical protein HPB49_003827 [Dermacentor silvarum]|uniref:Uncharacterized protein n=1 Tax=Dermacentor silvarum TaxID=543639 RepID=A0ACB8DTZ5_DERSI|nr:period circadian protein [Dermacentor silvarum]KAH7977875.1 hypothetical protein HPB49_003827 [Dermacentor silvarum]